MESTYSGGFTSSWEVPAVCELVHSPTAESSFIFTHHAANPVSRRHRVPRDLRGRRVAPPDASRPAFERSGNGGCGIRRIGFAMVRGDEAVLQCRGSGDRAQPASRT